MQVDEYKTSRQQLGSDSSTDCGSNICKTGRVDAPMLSLPLSLEKGCKAPLLSGERQDHSCDLQARHLISVKLICGCQISMKQPICAEID